MNKILRWLQSHQITFWLCLLALVAGCLRIHDISNSPPSPYWEEVALGYDAYAILETGKDHHGNAWPIVAFPSFGDYKPSLYFYTVVPSIAAFGLNTFAVRLPAALASTFTVVCVSWLVWKWSGSKHVAAWAGILLAIQPWSLVIGRAGFEVNLAVFLIILSVVIFEQARALKKYQFIYFAFGALLLALSTYAYHSARLWGPFIGILVFSTFFPWRTLLTAPKNALPKILPWIPAVVIAFVLLFPLLKEIRSPAVQQRVQQTSIFSDPAPIIAAVEAQEKLGNPWWARFAHHRWWYQSQMVLSGYSNHFSPSFLFGKGDVNPRHSSQFFGMLYPWELITVLSGIWAVLTQLRLRTKFLLGGLILLSPIAAMFTLTTPHALRALLLSPWLAVLSAFGMGTLLHFLWTILKNLSLPAWAQRVGFFSIFSAAGGTVLGTTLVFWYFLRFVYPLQAESEWQYGYEQVIQAVEKHKLPDEQIWMTREYGRPAMYVFFFTKQDPEKVQAASQTAPLDQLEILKFENWNFGAQTVTAQGIHAVPAGRDIPQESTLLETISGPSGKTYWEIIRTP